MNLSGSEITLPCRRGPSNAAIVAELDALQAEVDALKRLQAETAVGQKLKL